MKYQEDAIVDIRESQYAYFGGPGKLLIPSRSTIEAVLRQIPAQRILTTDLLRRFLAEQFNVQGTCPVATKKVLKALANQSPGVVPYWRVVKQNGELMTYFPGGTEAQAAYLRQEGFEVNGKGKTAKLVNFRGRIVQLGPLSVS